MTETTEHALMHVLQRQYFALELKIEEKARRGEGEGRDRRRRSKAKDIFDGQCKIESNILYSGLMTT